MMGSALIESSVPGILAGTFIAILIGYAIYLYLKPLRGERSGLGLAFAALVVLWIIKTVALYWFHGFYFDVDEARTWALRISEAGPAHFYAAGYATNFDYPPGGIYVLWPFGAIGRVFGLSSDQMRPVAETPPLIADIVIGLTMFAYLRRSGRRLAIAWAGMLLVALHPALLFDTVVWGQTDSEVTFLMWLTTLVALDGEYVMAGAVLAIAVLIKPHALIMIPPLACWAWRKNGFARLWVPVGAFIVTAVGATVPFAAGHPWDWLPRFYSAGMAAYRETSVNAFNLMAIVGGIRQPESAPVFGVSVFALGMALVLSVLALSCVLVWKNPFPRWLLFAIFLALFGEFLLGPRMHERYLYPAMVFFAPIALDGSFWLTIFALLTVSWLFNLAYVLHTLETVFWLPAYGAPAMLSGALNLVLFGAVLGRIAMMERGASR